MDPINYFKENSYAHIPGLVSPDLTNFIYNYLVIKACTNVSFGQDDADDNYVRYCYGDTAIETLSSVLLEKISYVTQKNFALLTLIVVFIQKAKSSNHIQIDLPVSILLQ